jgi:hypothetical protein
MPQMENGKWDKANLPPASSRTHISFRLPESYLHRNENFVLVLVATVSSFADRGLFVAGLPTITAKEALIVATQARDIKGEALA